MEALLLRPSPSWGLCCGPRRRSSAPRHEHEGAPTSARPLRAKPSKPSSNTPGGQDAAEEPLILTVQPPKNFRPSRPLERSSYRKPALDDEAIRARKAAQRRAREEQQRQLAGPWVRPGPPKRPPIMLIDAYNVLFRDTYLTGLLDKEPKFGRGELESWIELYAEAASIRCILVYDAMGSRGASKGVLGEYKRVSDRVTALFVTSSEADTYIVKEAWKWKAKGSETVVVVTDDNQVMIGIMDDDMAITGYSTNTFLQELKACKRGDTNGIRRYGGTTLASARAWQGLQQPPAAVPSGAAHSEAPHHAAAGGALEAAMASSDDLEGELGSIMAKHGEEWDDGGAEEDEAGGEAGGGEGAAEDLELDSLQALLNQKIG